MARPFLHHACGDYMQSVNVAESALLIRIARLYHDQMAPEALYEAVRGVWKVGVARSNVELVFAVANGIVREVFVVNQWHPAGTTHYVTRNMKDIQVRGRWEFTGIPASDKIRNKYIGKSVAHYFQRGNANPIFYVNAKVET